MYGTILSYTKTMIYRRYVLPTRGSHKCRTCTCTIFIVTVSLHVVLVSCCCLCWGSCCCCCQVAFCYLSLVASLFAAFTSNFVTSNLKESEDKEVR